MSPAHRTNMGLKEKARATKKGVRDGFALPPLGGRPKGTGYKFPNHTWCGELCAII